MLSLVLALCLAAHAAGARDLGAILDSMTLEQKVGQMVQIDIAKFMIGSTPKVNYTLMEEWITKYNIGSILNSPFSGGPLKDADGNAVVGWNATEWREFIIKMQTFGMESGAKIPLIYGIDSIHGATYIYGSALFPQALGTAASFDIRTAYDCAAVSAKDTRAAGIPWLFAPVLGLGLQPYWARFPETFGEDMYLAAQMGVATITGMQDIVDDKGIPTRAAACMKHFISYSDPTSGHDRSPVQLPDRIMRELYFPSFYAAVKAGVLTAMESYNEVGGIPMVSSSDYLITLLRQEMNFTGMMVTDYQEIENLHNWHKVSSTQRDAVELSMQDTSIDMSMVPLDTSFGTYLVDLVNSGDLDISRIDESVTRILNLKEQLGLFDTPIPSLSDPNIAKVGQAEDWALAERAAEGSITLVQNNNNVLPLASTTKVFLTGPTASSLASQSGGWSLHWQGAQYDAEFTNGTTVLQGMTTYFDTAPFYLMGPNVTASAITQDLLDEAYPLADAADAIVICVGEGTYAEKPGDIDDLALAQGQLDYVLALRAYVGPTKPIILVIISGRPRLLHQAVTNSDAVINAYCPGVMGGSAIAKIIVGEVVPSGRQPYTYPRNAGDIPYQYHHKPGDQCTNANGQCEVEWWFGYGLSYNTFTYSDFTLSTSDIDENGSIDISVLVTNTAGTKDADHSVLVFVYDLYRRVTPEYKLLKKFDKKTIPVGQGVPFTFTLNAEDLQYVGIDSRYILEGGSYMIGIGADVDCRTTNTDAQLSMYGGANMCKPFNLTLSTSYNAVCDYGCALWGQGLCGVTVESDECNSKCIKENWTFNYVDCLQQYSQASCSGADQIQCYDAFSMVDGNDDKDDDKDDHNFHIYVTILLIITAFSCFFGGMGIMWCMMRYFINAPELKESLLDTKYAVVDGRDENVGSNTGELKPVV